ncbi:hypothetical protein [Catellatospora methionotrophica]|uniref:hypothetical protein n=1 Tax=Catellatospora methionotrophica TaxID=121620 RepID=UPI0033CD17DE
MPAVARITARVTRPRATSGSKKRTIHAPPLSAMQDRRVATLLASSQVVPPHLWFAHRHSLRDHGRPEGAAMNARVPATLPSPDLGRVALVSVAHTARPSGQHQPAGSATAESRLQSLLLAGAHALYMEGNLQESRDWFDRAYRLAENEHDDVAQAIAAIGFSGLWVHEHRSATAAALTELRLNKALSIVEPESALSARIEARLAAEADYQEGGFERVFTTVEKARRNGDPLALAEALSLAHHCVMGPHQAPLRAPIVRELIQTSLRTRRRSDILVSLLWRTTNLFLAGDPHAERSLQDLRTQIQDQGHAAVGFVVKAMDVMRTIRAGDLDRAAQRAAACAQDGQSVGDVDATGWYGAHMIALHWYRGDIDQLVPSLLELVNSPTLSPVDNSHLAALAVAAATAGDDRLARGSLARLEGGGWSGLPMTSSWMATMYGVIESAHLLGDERIAEYAYAALLPFRRLPIMASMGVACFGSVEHALGVASLTLGEVDRAAAHFEAAIHGNQSLQHWPAAALSRMRLAEALWLRDGPADRVDAEREIAAFHQEAERMGMQPPASAARIGTARLDGGRAERLPPPLQCTRSGLHWELRTGERTILMEDSKGMSYLASLIANPGFEIPAAELAAGPGFADQMPNSSTGPSSAQPLLDEAAKRAYRQRLLDLDAAIAEFEQLNDVVRAERARDERSWLIEELEAVTGLGGRIRRFTDGAERARISVGKAIRRALTQIEATDPVIGNHLRSNVRTGMRCCYLPR